MSGKNKSALDVFTKSQICELIGLLDTVRKTEKTTLCVDLSETKEFAGWRVIFENTKANGKKKAQNERLA